MLPDWFLGSFPTKETGMRNINKKATLVWKGSKSLLFFKHFFYTYRVYFFCIFRCIFFAFCLNLIHRAYLTVNDGWQRSIDTYYEHSHWRWLNLQQIGYSNWLVYMLNSVKFRCLFRLHQALIILDRLACTFSVIVSRVCSFKKLVYHSKFFISKTHRFQNWIPVPRFSSEMSRRLSKIKLEICLSNYKKNGLYE